MNLSFDKKKSSATLHDGIVTKKIIRVYGERQKEKENEGTKEKQRR